MTHLRVGASLALATLVLAAAPLGAQAPPATPPPDPRARIPASDFLIPVGVESGLPMVQANDNRRAAGTDRDGVREISLEVMRADWRVETPDRPGLRVGAVAEAGGPPMIPAPLIRVATGTRLRVRIRNAVESPVFVFGLHTRDGSEPEPLVVDPGSARTVEFEAGEPGTYFYSMVEGPLRDPEAPASWERETLAGAFVVDEAGADATDRIMVINVLAQFPLSDASDTTVVEGATINGRSWPFTERIPMEVGKTERWRVINATLRPHPMHLHGFYYDVLSRGTTATDTIYAPESRRAVVTELMRPMTTMAMEWTPTRPGRWLFHCHLSFHVSPNIRLPGAASLDADGEHVHMAGLVMGIEVAPGSSDLVSRGETRPVELYTREYGEEKGYRYGFALDGGVEPGPEAETPGPLLTFHQYESADVTVHNRMSVPTGVHWHGLELDAWADGVPGWSASDGRVSPVIEVGASFTYRLSFMRPGTFIYHSHLNDVEQLSGGLYGPLIVLPPGETFDPSTDHLQIIGWKDPSPQEITDLELNGSVVQPVGRATVGETHRFRIVNIAPAGQFSAWMLKDGQPLPITLLAKDGADLPEHQRVAVPQLPLISVGETADFTWTPSEAGTYELRIGFAPAPEASFVQVWEVGQPEE